MRPPPWRCVERTRAPTIYTPLTQVEKPKRAANVRRITSLVPQASLSGGLEFTDAHATAVTHGTLAKMMSKQYRRYPLEQEPAFRPRYDVHRLNHPRGDTWP